MGVGLALGHHPPELAAEQLAREVHHARPPEGDAEPAELVQAIGVVPLDGPDAAVEIAEGMAVGGEDELHAAEAAEGLQRLEVGPERVGERREPGHVRRDGGQHVVAGDEQAGVGVEEAEVVSGMPRGVEGDPLPPGEADPVAVGQAMGRDRRAEPRQEVPPGEAGGPEMAADETPGFSTPGRPPPRAQAVARVISLRSSRPGLQPGVEALLGDELGARLVGEATRAPEVVGVRVGDEHGVHVADLEARRVQPALEGAPRLPSGEAGVDNGGPPLVEEHVAVHVAETGELDRELEPEHARTDLGHLARGGLLFLLAWPCAGWRGAHAGSGWVATKKLSL